MRVETWTKGIVPELDNLFDNLREQQYQNQEHRLWKNYSKDSFDSAVALTIVFDENNIPELCSSISIRDCWPKNTYRILNRLWKHSNKIVYPRKMSASFGASAKSQMEWLKLHTDFDLCFMSRQTDNWEKFAIENFHDQMGIYFKTDNYKYLTCPNECDDTCWQKIIYTGNHSVLEQWKRRQ